MQLNEHNNHGSELHFERATLANKDEWDRFVLAHNAATPYHLFAWGEAVQNAYGFAMHYWLARDSQSNRIVAVLPAVKIRSLKGKSSLCSLPYCDLGGILAFDEADYAAMLEYTTDIYGQSLNGKSQHKQTSALALELRNHENELLDVSEAPAGAKVRMLLPLPENADALMAQFKSKLRSQIRKAEKNGLSYKIVTPQQSDIGQATDEFYDIIAQNMHLLGSPVHSKAWYDEIVKAYNSNLYFALVYSDDVAVGAALIISTQNKAVVPWASTRAEYNRLAPNMLLYWALLSEAANRGIQEFDFGRSTVGEGTYNFKKQWGAVPQKLMWQQYQNGKIQNTSASSGSTSKARNLVENVWRRLPLSVSTALGSRLRKFISL
jgi:FemAB-related protein (PEP-CTERM system-associated)